MLSGSNFIWSFDLKNGKLKDTDKSQNYFVRCYRKNSDKEFKITSETVIDSSTGLMWQYEPDGQRRKWEDSKRYCRDLKIGGYSDWFLPNIDALEDMIDKKDLFGPFRRHADFWSSKAHPNVNRKNSGWYFNLGNGQGNYSNLFSNSRCVRDVNK